MEVGFGQDSEAIEEEQGSDFETEVQLGDLISVIDFVTSLQAVTALIVSNLTDSFSFMVACDYAYSF